MIHQMQKLKKMNQEYSSCRKQNELLLKDQVNYIDLLEKLSNGALPQFAELKVKMSSLQPVLIRLAEETAGVSECLGVMVQLFLLGLTQSPHEFSKADPYQLKQCELFLQSSEHLSIYGTAINLSRERHDSSGPLELGQEEIPSISMLFKALLLWAELSVEFTDQLVVLEVLKKRSIDAIDPTLVQKILQYKTDQERHSIIFLATKSLQSNMIVMEDIRNKHQLLLLAKGTILNDRLISVLAQYESQYSETLTVIVDVKHTFNLASNV